MLCLYVVRGWGDVGCVCVCVCVYLASCVVCVCVCGVCDVCLGAGW